MPRAKETWIKFKIMCIHSEKRGSRSSGIDGIGERIPPYADKRISTIIYPLGVIHHHVERR